MTYTIAVTEEDIKKGRKADCMFCPIALALKRKFPDRKVLVGPFNADVYPVLDIPLSRAARRFISDFDHTGEAKPFNFRIRM